MTGTAETHGWWRFTEYEIRDGWVRPAAGAQLVRFDPFDGFTSGPSSRTSAKSPIRRPYSGLLEIDALARRGRGTDDAEADLAAAIVRQCNSFGLLGVALDRTERVVFAPRIEDEASHSISRIGRVAVQRGYQRSGGRWEPTPPRIGRPSNEPVGTRPQIDYDHDGFFEQPHAVVADRTTRETSRVSLAAGWAPYFPTVPRGQAENFHYPPLFSDEFWQVYAEPVEEVIHASSNFAFSIVCIQHCLHPDPRLPADVKQTLRDSLSTEIARLNQWLSRASPTIDLQADGALATTWVGSSLLSMMAVLAHLDLTSRGRILSCAECNRVFYSMARVAKYCSPTCRQTTHTRRYRQKRRAAESSGVQRDLEP